MTRDEAPKDAQAVVNDKLSLAWSLAREGEGSAALWAAYEAQRLSRRDPKILESYQKLASHSRVLIWARRTFCDAIAGKPPALSAAARLPAVRDRERLEFLRLLFELCDAPVFLEVPSPDERQKAELLRQSLDQDALESLEAGLEPRKRVHSYQTDLLKDGTFQSRSLIDGASIDAAGSLLVQAGGGRPFLFYHVGGVEPYFEFIPPFGGECAAHFIPGRNLAVGRASAKNHHRTFAYLKALVVEHAAAVVRYVRPDAPRRLTLLSGAMNHFGHTVLNEYEAIHQAAGQMQRLEDRLMGPFAFLDQSEAFPEIPRLPTTNFATMQDAFIGALELNAMIVRPTTSECWMSRGLRERVVKLVGGSAAGEAAKVGPLIWFEVRSNDRYWIGQAAGIAAIADELAKDYPRLGIVVAGWSVMNEASTTPYDTKMVAADHALAEEIRTAVAGRVRVFDITGARTVEKMAWAVAVDASATVYGTGVVFPQGIGRVSGVIFCNSTYLKELEALGGRVPYIEDCPKILLLEPSRITDAPTTASFAVQNFDLDWRDVLERLRALLTADAAPAVPVRRRPRKSESFRARPLPEPGS